MAIRTTTHVGADAMRDIANRINAGSRILSESDRSLALAGPTTLTVKVGSRFSKRGFIGEEQFLCNGAYVGKRGAVIVLFSQVRDDDGPAKMDVEVPLNDCAFSFAGFMKFLSKLDFVADDSTMGAARFFGLEKEKEARLAEVLSSSATNPVFGSW